ncbi:lysophospholipase L2 [Salmonella enterica subsp. enterica]|uniref:Lysophospholipase L2 n=1 Tax=Salmonella enterica I TaxID=59201 RepID=A0A447TRD4_SALET|nr:lysophospholipase L2 [Salmonella enterica subsp. enterica]
MFQQQNDWETRENAFACFLLWGPLTDFWRQREEAEFIGVGKHSGCALSVFGMILTIGRSSFVLAALRVM